jgi:hypothetical protein
MATKLSLLLLLTLAFTPVYSQDPTNKQECVDMLQVALKTQCTTLFGTTNPALEKTCLDTASSETAKQCDRFFGSDNFCGVCTSECVNQFEEQDPTRLQCLQTCLSNPACTNQTQSLETFGN